ncbi:MAG: hypothetical protein OEY22_05955 [Candidatus Bathyarchaeota archaeon]|nr:hypothetical protein [Candidatus Bathyarchaeota archaeon]MDH5788396.1 hypothetical protein [Candidatus Bathyarchaeota archaeon]
MPKFLFHKFLAFTIAAGIFGMLTTLMLAFNPPAYNYDFAWRRPLVGLMFAIVCTAGMFAAVVPGTCLSALGHDKANIKVASGESKAEKKVFLKGHHFDCGRFSNHTVVVRNNVLCAACFGLALGAFIALLGTIVYFFLGMNLFETSLETVLFGEVAVALGLVEFKLKGYLRLLLNSVFVLGGFLTLVGVDSLTENLLVDFYLIGLIILWILTRILLSQWDHWRTCHVCMEPCTIVEKEKEF